MSPTSLLRMACLTRRYVALSDRWIKRSWYELNIYEPFDAGKLAVDVEIDEVFGIKDPVEVFQLYYDGVELVFRENYGVNAEDTYLLSSSGERRNFNVLEEDSSDYDETPDDED